LENRLRERTNPVESLLHRLRSFYNRVALGGGGGGGGGGSTGGGSGGADGTEDDFRLQDLRKLFDSATADADGIGADRAELKKLMVALREDTVLCEKLGLPAHRLEQLFRGAGDGNAQQLSSWEGFAAVCMRSRHALYVSSGAGGDVAEVAEEVGEVDEEEAAAAIDEDASEEAEEQQQKLQKKLLRAKALTLKFLHMKYAKRRREIEKKVAFAAVVSCWTGLDVQLAGAMCGARISSGEVTGSAAMGVGPALMLDALDGEKRREVWKVESEARIRGEKKMKEATVQAQINARKRAAERVKEKEEAKAKVESEAKEHEVENQAREDAQRETSSAAQMSEAQLRTIAEMYVGREKELGESLLAQFGFDLSAVDGLRESTLAIAVHCTEVRLLVRPRIAVANAAAAVVAAAAAAVAAAAAAAATPQRRQRKAGMKNAEVADGAHGDTTRTESAGVVYEEKELLGIGQARFRQYRKAEEAMAAEMIGASFSVSESLGLKLAKEPISDFVLVEGMFSEGQAAKQGIGIGDRLLKVGDEMLAVGTTPQQAVQKIVHLKKQLAEQATAAGGAVGKLRLLFQHNGALGAGVHLATDDAETMLCGGLWQAVQAELREAGAQGGAVCMGPGECTGPATDKELLQLATHSEELLALGELVAARREQEVLVELSEQRSAKIRAERHAADEARDAASRSGNRAAGLGEKQTPKRSGSGRRRQAQPQTQTQQHHRRRSQQQPA
jgi:hypothetical protein